MTGPELGKSAPGRVFLRNAGQSPTSFRMNEILPVEALRQLFADETLFLVPEPAPVVLVEPATARAETHGAKGEGQRAEDPAPTPAAESVAPLAPVVAPAEPVLPPAPPPFRRETIVLVDRPSPEDLALLENILKAVSLTLADVDLLDLQQLKGQDFKPLLESKTAHQFISFGVGLKKLNLDLVLVPYRIQPVEGVQFLLADPLAQLHTDKAKKKALWIGLQVLFGVA
jgi:hypothetical protein